MFSSCAEFIAQGNLDRLAERAAGQPLVVEAGDFNDVDLSSVESLRGLRTSSDGSTALREAMIVDPGLRTYIAHRGYPDDLVLLEDRRLQLIYVSVREVVVIEQSRSNEPGAVRTRPLMDKERVFVDPDVRRRLGMAGLRTLIASYDRTWKVFTRVCNVTPNLPPSQPGLAMLWADTTPASRGTFYVPEDVDGLVIVWIAPDSKASTLVRSGDVVTAVDGIAVRSHGKPARSDSGSPSNVRLTVWHQGATRDVDIPLELQPPVNLIVSFVDTPNAFANGNYVRVTTGMLELMDDDDSVAAVIGHELGHISAGHTSPSLAGMLSLGITVPLELVLPGVGHSAIAAVESPFSRDQERDADRIGIELARQAGYDPSAAVRVLEKLQAVSPTDGSGFFATHPSLPERIAAARAAAGPTASTQATIGPEPTR